TPGHPQRNGVDTPDLRVDGRGVGCEAAARRASLGIVAAVRGVVRRRVMLIVAIGGSGVEATEAHGLALTAHRRSGGAGVEAQQSILAVRVDLAAIVDSLLAARESQECGR